ncbi:MAG TPA: biotin/lipoyl-containing protein [Candidatus Polarisedimenticolia bacterium]|jgi:3-methylcrotonyl-CoA carboxylase alpha subunit|nr:biotin/lipoyl-containing protein [Candidatus Polarisedimenticolia bacterium]
MAFERRYRAEGAEFRVSLEPSGGGHLAEVDGRAHAVRVLRFEEGVLDLRVGDRIRRFHVASDPQRLFVFSAGRSYRLERVDPIRRAAGARGADKPLEAQMPALVRSVVVQEGDRVERGATLVVLEAMKMEIRMTAPQASVVARIRCREGERVERGQVLVEIHPAEDSP